MPIIRIVFFLLLGAFTAVPLVAKKEPEPAIQTSSSSVVIETDQSITQPLLKPQAIVEIPIKKEKISTGKWYYDSQIKKAAMCLALNDFYVMEATFIISNRDKDNVDKIVESGKVASDNHDAYASYFVTLKTMYMGVGLDGDTIQKLYVNTYGVTLYETTKEFNSILADKDGDAMKDFNRVTWNKIIGCASWYRKAQQKLDT